MEPRDQRHRTRRDEGNGALGKATLKAKPRWVAASELGSERVSIARVDGNAARECKSARPGASTGSASDQGKAVRLAASEWSRGNASDMDGQNREVEWSFWEKRHRRQSREGSGEEAGTRPSFKWAGAHESKLGSKRVSIARVDGNAARVAG